MEAGERDQGKSVLMNAPRKRGRPRMLRPEERENRMQADTPSPSEPEKRAESYPCKWCQGSTTVTKTFPPIPYTRQHPIQWLKRRTRKCLECGRSFATQEHIETPLET